MACEEDFSLRFELPGLLPLLVPGVPPPCYNPGFAPFEWFGFGLIFGSAPGKPSDGFPTDFGFILAPFLGAFWDLFGAILVIYRM